MTLELSRLSVLRRGWTNTEVVGPLHQKGVAYLKSKINVVSLSRERLVHIDQHGGFTDFEIITIPFGLESGLFIADDKKHNHLIISYLYPDNDTRYKAVIKSANHGSELWVCTFHRMRPRQTKNLLVRGSIIKKHF